MYLQELIEVAIGLIFIWFVMSLATMQIQEVIANFLGKRARDLESTIANLINDPEKVIEFYRHPLIKGLTQPISEQNDKILQTLEAKFKKKESLNLREQLTYWWISKRPSYIPAKDFATAIFDIVSKAGTEQSPLQTKFKEIRAALTNLSAGDIDTVHQVLDHISKLGQMALESKAGSDIQKSLEREIESQIRELGRIHKDIKPLADDLEGLVKQYKFNLGDLFQSDQLIEQVRRGAQALGPNSDLGKSLYSLMAGAEEYATGIDKALAAGRTNVENWFDNIMDRMGGWYKRWAMAWAFGISLVLAILFNVDSIDISIKLWQEPELRKAYNSYIDNYMAKNVNPDDPNQSPDLSSEDLQTIREDVLKLKLPLGWESANFIDNFNAFWANGWQKIAGFLITALAAMQGAPFWFDILKKLVNIRGTGANPSEKSKEGEQKPVPA